MSRVERPAHSEGEALTNGLARLSDDTNEAIPLRHWAAVSLVLATLVVLALTGIQEPVLARAAIIAGVCLVLWLSEIVPPYVPTLILWGVTPLLLQRYGDQFSQAQVFPGRRTRCWLFSSGASL